MKTLLLAVAAVTMVMAGSPAFASAASDAEWCTHPCWYPRYPVWRHHFYRPWAYSYGYYRPYHRHRWW
jgi:hypothetical protein